MTLLIPNSGDQPIDVFYERLTKDIIRSAYFDKRIVIDPDGYTYAKINGVYQKVAVYVKVSGAWVKAKPYYKKAGVWGRPPYVTTVT